MDLTWATPGENEGQGSWCAGVRGGSKGLDTYWATDNNYDNTTNWRNTMVSLWKVGIIMLKHEAKFHVHVIRINLAIKDNFQLNVFIRNSQLSHCK